ncbi:MAG: TrmH family RNA methyltransferase [Pyrinomonadaceae bacterium]
MDESIITSRNNPRLARIRKVRDGKAQNEIFVEGRRVVEEVARSSAKVIECVISDEFAESESGQRIRTRLAHDGVPILKVSASLFKSVSDTVHAQGIALIAGRPLTGRKIIEDAFTDDRTTLVVCLSEVSDPSNVGAVFRTAEAAGVTGVALSKGSADAFSAKAVRAGMGSNLRVPTWDNADLADTINWALGHRMKVIAADINGELSYSRIDWRKPSMVVFGSEARGLDPAFLAIADKTVTIPMNNGVESLNLAVSAGIILFEAVRQNSSAISTVSG